MEHEGYTYTNQRDQESDGTVKLFHKVCAPDGSAIDMDWDSYSEPTIDDFILWIRLGCPRRTGLGPLDHNGLGRLARDQYRVAVAREDYSKFGRRK